MSTKLEAIEFARRAMQRSAAVVHREMGQGLHSLATVVCLAPFFGVLGTMIGIVNSFKGIAGQREAIMSARFDDFAQACELTALGLLVAVPSLWFYKYLTGRLECFDREMKAASLDLLNLLTLRPMRAAPVAEVDLPPEAPIFRDALGAELWEDRRPWYRSHAAVGSMLIASWCIQIVRSLYAREYDVPPLESAIEWSAVYVIFTFAISWFVGYPIWVRIFRRASGGLAALASLMCLLWSSIELLWGAHLW